MNYKLDAGVEPVMNRLKKHNFCSVTINQFCASLFFAMNLTLAGCTIANYGALVAKYTRTETATVVDVYSLGLQIRPKPPDLGGSLGFRRSSYIFSRPDNVSHIDVSQWHWFSWRWPSAELVARGSTSLGIELQASAEVGRFTIGYVDQLITAGPTADESKILRLYYNRSHPEYTFLSLSLPEGVSK